MTRITITLPDDMAQVLPSEALRRRSNVSAVIREIVAQVLGGSAAQPKEIPWAGIFHDSGATAEDLDDLLEQEWAVAVDGDRG